MKVKKILFILCLIILFFAASLFGTILYFYYHPDSVKPFLEKTLSRSFGTTFSIKSLSYSLRPLRFRAEGITSISHDAAGGINMKISRLGADVRLQGPFGRKVLTFKTIQIDGFDLELSGSVDLTRIGPKKTGPSFLTPILKRVAALFLFRDIEFEAAQLTNSHMVARFGDQIIEANGIDARMTADHHIGMSCTIQMRWPSQGMVLMAPDVHITTDQAISFVAPQIKGLLKAQEVVFESATATVNHAKTEAVLIYDHNQRRLAFEPLDLRLTEITWKHKAQEMTLPFPVDLKAQGTFDLARHALDASLFDLVAGEIARLKGRLELRPGPETKLRLEQLEGQLMPQVLLPLLPDELKTPLAPLRLSGPVGLHGSMDGLKKGQGLTWHTNLEARLQDNPFSVRTGGMDFGGKISGSILAEGTFPDLRISSKMKGAELTLSGQGVETKPFRVDLSLSGRHPVYVIEDLSVLIPQAVVKVKEKAFSIDDIKVDIRNGKIDGIKRSLVAPDIELTSSHLKNLHLSLAVDPKNATIKLQGKDVHLMETAAALNLLPPNWKVAGTDAVQAEALLREGGNWSFVSEIGYQDLGFENRDSTAMGQKLSITARVDGTLDSKLHHISAKTTLKIHGGEILYDRFYFDLNANPVSFSCETKYDLMDKSLLLSDLGFGLKDILSLHMDGTLAYSDHNPQFHLSLLIPPTSLGPLFHHLVLEPFKAEKPLLTGLTVGGTVSANVDLKGTSGDWTLTGQGTLREGEISSADKGFSLKRIGLELPVWYQSSVRREESPKETPLKGKLSIQSVLLPPLPEQSLTLLLEAGPNRLSVRSPTNLQVPGGEIRLGPVMAKDLFSPGFTLDTSLTIGPMDLRPLLSRFWSQPVEGQAEGRLESIHLEGNHLTTRGTITARAFGGHILLSDLGVMGVFTAAPALRLNIRLNHLDLAQITGGTSFGKIEGILEGYINRLVIAYGQPQGFDLLLETVKEKGVSQKISLKALDNIAQLGGGQSPFVGMAGTFAAFFREFPYSKIGIHALLENDVFRIHGTIKEEGKEYLIKRGGFSGVNVVNQNPDNRISFKDMINRIKRITVSKGGPVVK